MNITKVTVCFISMKYLLMRIFYESEVKSSYSALAK